MNLDFVEQPEKRGQLRSFLGREYFILKRKFHWLRNRHQYASSFDEIPQMYPVIKHKSVLLRPLKDVDMYLQYNKIKNLELAIKEINGVLIKPNQVFSIWKLVKRPTKSKGYLEGLTLHNGKTSTDIGGGLCQLGNLLYWMFVHSDLDITQRWRHSFDVFPDINRKIPFGCGATLSYNYVDLEVTNNTDNAYKILLWLDDEYLHGELLVNHQPNHKFEVFETDHIIRQQWWGGYTRHNKIWKRRINLTDKSSEEILITENHAVMMYNPWLENSNN